MDTTLTIRMSTYHKNMIHAVAKKRHLTAGDLVREFIRSLDTSKSL